MGMHNYHELHRCLPPACLNGPDGKPWHSWRVLLLPHIEQRELYKQYRFDEPWDGPNNRQLMSIPTPNVYACPADSRGRAAGRTNYFVVVGPGTPFPPAKPADPEYRLDLGPLEPGGPLRMFLTRPRRISFSDFKRPTGETVLVVEAKGLDIHWMEPQDLSFDTMSFTKDDPTSVSASSRHRTPNYSLANGIIRSMNDLGPKELRAMMLIEPEK